MEDQGYKVEKHLKKANAEKDAGVVLLPMITWTVLPGNVNKANKLVVGLIRKTFVAVYPEIFKPLSKALVRPDAEYADQV